ncbi:DUF1283 domain-containing protein [Serratia marcescens]|nr:DUF1283 domain-containing protein [Serratia marcescens]HEJ7007237.1 DUF1283 domain-containing protein [Serratia marcescens]
MSPAIRDKNRGSTAPGPAIQPPDLRAQCAKSKNMNAYWEAVTERCLDRNTGNEVAPS